MKKVLAYSLLLIALVASLVYWTRSVDDKVYRLLVHNNTAATVDMIRVFGSGAMDTPELTQLGPGESGVLRFGLRASGQLRFEIMRGYNRIDAIFEDDVSTLSRNQQWLVLNKNNHFEFSDTAPR